MKTDKTDRTIRALHVPRLVVQLPDGKEIHHHVVGSELTIGRDVTNRILIPDHFVSKFHAKLLVSQTSMTLVDLDSANKTYVNGRQVQECTVRFGDELRFAGVTCRLEAPGPKHTKPSETAAGSPPPQPAAEVEPRVGKVPSAAPRPPRQPTQGQKSKPPAAPGRARSTPPKVEAFPMRRLFLIGGLLIAICLVLAIFLRIVLIPSETTEEAGGESSTSGSAPVVSPPSAPTDREASVPASATTSSTASVQSAGGRDAEFYFDEGLAHLDTWRLKEAQRSFERALELDPDHTRARTRLSLLDEEIEKKAETHFDNGSEAFQFLRYDEAIAEWEMFLMLAKESDTRYTVAQEGIEQARAKVR
jgi:pSer/pThr/pTyr-binding forkhead associated (FHA) protein